METQTLTNYGQTKEKHLEDKPMDVVTNEKPDSPQTKSVCGESSESTRYIENRKSPPHIENKDLSQGDCDKFRFEERANESEDDVNENDLGRIEEESEEDCEEEEKLLLSPTRSDEEYDTEEEDDRDYLSAVKDTDKFHIRDETEKLESDDKLNISESPMLEESKRTSSPPQIKISNERTNVKDYIDKGNKKVNEHEIDKNNDVDKIDDKNNENKTVEKDSENINEDAYQNDEIDEAEAVKEETGAEIVEKKATTERAVNDDNIEKTGYDIEITRHCIEITDVTFHNEIMNEKDEDHIEGMNVEGVDSLGDTCVTVEIEETEDLTTDMSDPLSTENKEKEVKEVENPALPSDKDHENKQHGDKVYPMTLKKSEENKSKTKDIKKSQDMEVERKTTATRTAKRIKGERDADCPLLRETLTKSADCDKSRAYEAVEMDEDFDPSLLCPEMSMEVDESPVITENENPVQYTKIHCTACNVHLGSALNGQGNRFVHPLLKVLICEKCYRFYRSGDFGKDEDGSELYCRWCGKGGQVICCSNCKMVFCKKCITINFDKKKIAAITDSDDWLCFRCNPSQLIHLRIHCSDFMKYVQREMANVSSLEEYAAYQSTDYCQCCISPKKKAAEPAAVEPRRKRNKPLVPEDPVNDPIKDDSTTPTPPPVVATPSSATVASALENVSTPPPAKAPKALQKGGPRRKGHVPANAAFRAVGPGHTPRPRIQVVQQGQAYVMSSSDFRTIYLYEYKLNQSAAKTAQKINEAFGNGSVNERTVRRWFAKFRSGDFSLEDEPRSGRPTVIQDEALRSLMETDPSQTVRGMAKELGVSPHAVFDGLNRIGKRSSDLRRSAPSAQTFLR